MWARTVCLVVILLLFLRMVNMPKIGWKMSLPINSTPGPNVADDDVTGVLSSKQRSDVSLIGLISVTA